MAASFFSSFMPVGLRVILFSLASNTAVVFVLKFGQALWPEGLPAHSQNAFWLASGVNVAGLLLLGWRFWPVILLDAIPAWWLASEPLELTTLGSATNAGEALLAAWLIRKADAGELSLEKVRVVLLLLIASIVAPLVDTVIIPAYFCLRGAMPWESYGQALGNWNLANGTAILMVTPLILSLVRGRETWQGREAETIMLAIAAVLTCAAAFSGFFSGAGTNLAFLAFPVVIYAAVRFGIRGVALIFAIMLTVIYETLAMHARDVPASTMAARIWFVQAFCWVAAATGLLVAALMAERERAEKSALAEKSRALEASLREERARLDALRYQINPHFLFNTLNSIRAEIPLQDEIPREMLTNLAEYLRSTLERPDGDTLTLREEIVALEHYLTIEQKRFGDRLRVRMEIDAAAREIEVPVFLLQPLVENAIRHGLEASKQPCDLHIYAMLKERRLKIEVANSGDWKEEGVRKGLGLENIRRRLELLYGDAARLERIPDEGWVRFDVDLPIKIPKPHALPDHR